MLAAHRQIGNEQHREEVAAFWGVEKISSTPGLTATQMIESLERGELKAAWIICTNPMVSLPDLHRAEAAFALRPCGIDVRDVHQDFLGAVHVEHLAAGTFSKMMRAFPVQ